MINNEVVADVDLFPSPPSIVDSEMAGVLVEGISIPSNIISIPDGNGEGKGKGKGKGNDDEDGDGDGEGDDVNDDASSTGGDDWGDFDQDQSTSNGSAGTGHTPSSASAKNGGGAVRRESLSLSIAHKENTYVNRMRILMFTVLIVTTITVAVVVYTFVSKAQRNDFETSFEVDSSKIYESLGSSMDTKLEAVDSLALLMVSSAQEKNDTWPYTILTDFASKAAKMRILSNAIALQQYQWVEEDKRSDWEQYAKENEGWVQEAIEVERLDTTFTGPVPTVDYCDLPTPACNNFSTSIRYGGPVENNTGPYTPSWQTYPMLPTGKFSAYNFNAIQHKFIGPGIRKVVKDHKVVIGPVLNFEDSIDASGNNRVSMWAERHVNTDEVDASEPVIRILYPVLDTEHNVAVTVDQPDSKVVSIIASSFFWRSFLENILPEGERGLIVVFKNTCNQTFTYQVNGHEAEYVGGGDLHESREHPQYFNDMGRVKSFDEIGLFASTSYAGLPIDEEYCMYTVSTYPSILMYDDHISNAPFVYTICAVGIFIFTALIFMGYDVLVTMRQEKVMTTAVQSTTIISSLFPSNVRDRLLEAGGVGGDTSADNNNNNDSNNNKIFKSTNTRLRTFLNDGEPASESNKPIADLFTDTTVLFADIAGFTAWSSVREPTQVFTLLETVYGAFDTIAARRGVFKVETIGDSYVAVTGLPDPRQDHAVAMVKFARDCRQQFNALTKELEVKLGPDTGDLLLRIGLHSGPVTAGVLRGQKSRFQLFGDTVNTAARMESTGKINKIQVSQTTADLLKKAKKLHWLTPREDMVEAKGKGFMKTYWVEIKQKTESAGTSLTSSSNEAGLPLSLNIRGDPNPTPRISSNQKERLINWNVDVLERLLKKVVSRRAAIGKEPNIAGGFGHGGGGNAANWNRPHETMVLNEVKEVIKLPEYNPKYTDTQEDPDSIVLEKRVRSQLREFVTAIAHTYHDENPFHNFPHASHVGMSVAKLLSRIVAPDKDFDKHEQLHDHTYGITSDPLTQFACVFSALIHDANHPGVPNSQLVKEDAQISRMYEGKSIAEQDSINLSWQILIEPQYSDLRKAICKTRQEEIRFRQLVVSAVCATDIMDKDLKHARNERWAKAFSTTTATTTTATTSATTSSLTTTSSSSSSSSSSAGTTTTSAALQEQINRKATIVIEHIIQASDIAHTMQHWHIYIKWNERLYAEMYNAYVEGRADNDPTESWYKGEIGFFDFYIIPLAQKLSECGVFGVSSDEYLNYATMNRNEWEKKGNDVVAGYVKKYKR